MRLAAARVVHINPLVEIGATKTIVPHEMVDMALFKSTSVSDMNIQVRPGGDLALLRGMAKVVFEAAESDPTVLDHAFLAEHTAQFEAYRDLVSATSWAEITEQAGLAESEIRRAGGIYLAAKRTVISWCLGVTQHEHGVDSAREIVNLLLLRGNIGRTGPGRRLCAGTAMCKATGRAASITAQPPTSWTSSTKCAALSRRANMDSTPSPPSKGCTTAGCKHSSGWAEISCWPRPTPPTRQRVYGSAR